MRRIYEGMSVKSSMDIRDRIVIGSMNVGGILYIVLEFK